MKSYIENYLDILPDSQRAKIEALLDVGPKLAEGSSEDQIESSINDMITQLGSQRLTMQLRLQPEGGQTDSESFYTTLKEIIADLNSLYSESNRLDTLIFNHSQLNKSILDGLLKDYKTLSSKIDMINLLADNREGYGTASREDFTDQKLFETDRETYKYMFADANGNPITNDNVIDTVDNSLKLGSTSSFDRIHNTSGNTVASIEIIEQNGGSFTQKDPRFTIDQAVDSRLDTFWGEVILSDGTIKVPLETTIPGLSGGALCAFKVKFANPCTVSQFSIKPYCEFPIDLLAIGYTVDSTNDITGWIVTLEQTEAEEISFDTGLSMDFPCVTATSMIFIIRQSHARKDYYLVTKDKANDAELWAKITAAESKATLESPWQDDEDPDTINPTLGQDIVEQFDSRWQSYLKETKRAENQNDVSLAVSAASGIFTYATTEDPAKALLTGVGVYSGTAKSLPDEPERIQVEKYEYVYGAYDIQIKGNEYNPTGIYISQPHQVNGNIQTVVLEAQERHPKFMSKNEVVMKQYYDTDDMLKVLDEPLRKTTVEYYVSSGDQPTDIWYPILPLDQMYVNNELLIFRDRNNPVAELRFCADTEKPMRVYKNGAPMRYYTWTTAASTALPLPNTKRILISGTEWDADAIYTIDYYVSDNPVSSHEIDFLNTAGVPKGTVIKTVSEYFNGPGSTTIDKNCSAKLTYYPYIDRGKLSNINYNPVRVTLNPSDYKYANPLVYRILGKTGAVTSQITSTRDSSLGVTPTSYPRLLNATNYSEGTLPVLNAYETRDPLADGTSNPTPTFEYYQDGKRIHFSEPFNTDGSQKNNGIQHGNAIVQIDYEYLVSGVRVKIILRRTSSDASVTPKVDWYVLKFKTLV